MTTSNMKNTPIHFTKVLQTTSSETITLFQVQEMHVYYIGGISYVNVGLVIDPSLPKLAKDRQLVAIS